MLLRIAIAAAVLTVGACTPKELSYDEEIAAWRADKDRFMRESPQSPVEEAKRPTFPQLVYFPTNPEYRVPAALSVSPCSRRVLFTVRAARSSASSSPTPRSS